MTLGAPAIQRPALSGLLVPKEGQGELKEAEGELSSFLPRKSSDQLELKTRVPESLEMRDTARDPPDLGSCPSLGLTSSSDVQAV